MIRSLYKKIVIALFFISLFCFVAYMWRETTLNFTILGVIGIVLGLTILLLRKYSEDESEDSLFNDFYKTPDKDALISIYAGIFLLIFSGFTIATLRNYFYADKSVYSNNMHHALRLDGFSINNPDSVVLAKNDNTAIFDNKDFNGSVVIRNYNSNDSTITLVAKGFTHPIYIDTVYGDKIRKELLNKRNFIVFKENDTITFVKHNGQGVEEEIEFWFNEYDNAEKDSADYYFRYNGNTAISNVKTLFKVGYDMNSLLAGIPFTSFNFNGIDIVRVKPNQRANNDEISDAGGTDFVLNINNKALDKDNRYISRIIHKGIEYDLAQSGKEDVISIKMEKNEIDSVCASRCITIGYGETKSSPFRFVSKGDGRIFIEFDMPYYRPLNNYEGNITETVLVANSLMNNNVGDNGSRDSLLVIEKAPSNMVVFDIFDHNDNKYLFKPFHLSFAVGDTRERMSFLCQKYDSISNDYSCSAVCSKKSIFRQNENLVISIDTQEETGNVTWEMCVENLRESTPFNSQKMMWTVLFVALASVLSIVFHILINVPSRDNRPDTFTYVEYIAYIVLIFFIAFRCFLLWRTSVFHPLENVSSFEMNTIFYETAHYKWMIGALILFFVLINGAKFIISRMDRYSISDRLFKNELFVLGGGKKRLILSVGVLSILYLVSLILMYSGSTTTRIGIALFVILYFLIDILINTIYYPTFKSENIVINERMRLRVVTPLFLTFLNMALTTAFLLKPDSGFMIMFATFCLITFCFKLLDLYTKVYRDRGHRIYYAAILLLILVVVVLILYRTIIINAFYSTSFIISFSLILIGVFFILCREMRIPVFALRNQCDKAVPCDEVKNEEGRVINIKSAIFSLLFVLASLCLTAYVASLCCSDLKCVIAIFAIEMVVALLIVLKTYRGKIGIALLCACVLALIAVLFSEGVTMPVFSNMVINKPVALLLLIVIVPVNAFILSKVCVPIVLYESVKSGAWVPLITWVVLLVLFVSGILTFSRGISVVDIIGRKGNHTVQRINVLINEPHEALARIDNNNDEKRFLQASHNHWILNQYKKRSENVEILGEKGNGYFKMQPQSKLGAMWNAQVTDIIILRYVITEHSRILPVIFIALLLLMVYFGLRKTTYYRFTKSLLVQIPLLLFTQSALIWLANTGRFIFFGQDFPLLSITAKIMVIYSIALICIWILAAIIESFMYKAYNEDDNYEGISHYNEELAKTASFLLIVFLSVITFIQPHIGANRSDKYGMEPLIKRANDSYIPIINKLFAEYQKDSVMLKNNMHPIKLKNNMHPDIVAFAEAKYDTLNNKIMLDTPSATASSYITINDWIRKKFKEKAWEEATNRYICNECDTTLLSHELPGLCPKCRGELYLNLEDTTAYNFPLRIWENYVKYGSYDNKYSNLVHLHNAKKDSLVIAMRTNYYELSLPLSIKDDWRGNIVERAVSLCEQDTVFPKDDVKFYILNKDWVAEGEARCIVKGGADSIYRMENVKVWNKGNTIRYNGRLVESSFTPKPTYWARSVMVNGKPQFIYPYGESLYWIKDFAEKIVKTSKNNEIAQYKGGDKDCIINSDVEITLNGALSKELYSRLKTKATEGQQKAKEYLKDLIAYSVIVADGDGQILAIVDSKPGYEVNPNDTKRINEIVEKLYMNVDGDRYIRESQYFENKNFVRMDAGPGSSQKPIVWTAVASAIDNIDWSNFKLEKVTDISKDDKYFYAYKFNGDAVYEFSSLLGDELKGIEDVTLDKFLKKSSNYYNAAMVYIGLHNRDLYDSKDFTKQAYDDKELRLFRKYPKLGRSENEYRDHFPFFKDKNGGIYTFDKKINKDELDKSVLYHQMSEKFGLGVEYVKNRINRDAKQLYPNMDTIVRNQFIIPQASVLNFNLFKNDKENNTVRAIAIGQQSAWEVTPLSMAEMYGKMVRLSSMYNFSFIPNAIKTTAVKDIGVGNAAFINAEPIKYLGMSQCFNNGTAHNDGGKEFLRKKGMPYNSDSGSIVYNNKNYYIYAKTGTTNEMFYVRNNVRYSTGSQGGVIERPDLRRMAIIISDRQLCADNEDAKFIIMYFAIDYYKLNFHSTVYECIAEVIASDAFSAYMNSEAQLRN